MNGIHEGKKCGLVDHPACFMGKFRRETGLASKHYQQAKPSVTGHAPVVQKVDNQINHYPLDIAIGFAITYPVDSDLSGG